MDTSSHVKQSNSAFSTFTQTLLEVGKKMKAHPEVISLLSEPQRVVEVTLPLEREDDATEWGQNGLRNGLQNVRNGEFTH